VPIWCGRRPCPEARRRAQTAACWHPGNTIGAIDEMVELTRRPATPPPGRKRTSHAVDDVNTESDDAPDPFEY